MNTETKIKLLKNAIKTVLNLITYELDETVSPTDYTMLGYHNRSYNDYVNLLNKIANGLELTYTENMSLEGVLQAQVEILLGE